jgi:hypothetical protein
MKITLPSISTSLDLSRFLSQSLSFSFSRLSATSQRRQGWWRSDGGEADAARHWSPGAWSPRCRWVAAGAAARTHRGIGTLSHLCSRGYYWRRSPCRPVPVAPLPTAEVSALYRRGILPDRPCTRQGKGALAAAWPMPQPEARASRPVRRRRSAAPSMAVFPIYSMFIFSQPSCLYINRMCLLLFDNHFYYCFWVWIKLWVVICVQVGFRDDFLCGCAMWSPDLLQ